MPDCHSDAPLPKRAVDHMVPDSMCTPVVAGIDPCNTHIDRNSDENDFAVTQ